MKVITVTSGKGGVGKTGLALGIAYELAQNQGKKVLFIDMDTFNSASSHFTSDYDLINGRTIRQVLKGELDIKDVILPNMKVSNLHFIPAEFELRYMERELAGYSTIDFLLYNALQDIEDEYYACVIDTAPSFSLLARMAVNTADYVVIPHELKKWSARSVHYIFHDLEECRETQRYINKEMKKILVVPSFYKKQDALKNLHLYQIWTSDKGPYVSSTVIHDSADVTRVHSFENEFLHESTKCSIEYRIVTNELLGIEQDLSIYENKGMLTKELMEYAKDYFTEVKEYANAIESMEEVE